MMAIRLAVVMCLVGSALFADDSFTVGYTGRMLGYYRIPEVQSKAQRECRESDATAEWTKDVLAKKSRADLWVSLGDVFSPDLYSRMLQDKRMSPKEQSEPGPGGGWVDAGEGQNEEGKASVPFDNVGCFLRSMGYRAFVPGKHDFAYGPERLRQLSKYLVADKERRVETIGANLAFLPLDKNPPAKTVTPAEPTNYASKAGEAKIDVPSVPLPYLRRFEVKNGLARFSYAWLCNGEVGATFDKGKCEPLTAAPAGTDPKNQVFYVSGPVYPADKAPLQPGRDYQVCASETDDQKLMGKANTICSKRFAVHYPLFQWESGDPRAWALDKDGKVAVFAIVDPELKEHIGQLNYTWMHQTQPKKFEAQIEVADALESLRQVLQSYAAEYPDSTRRKILLAQMPEWKVRRLLPALGDDFDLVITQAEEAAGTEASEITLKGNRRTVVVVPAEHMDPEKTGQIRPTVQTVTITNSAASRVAKNEMLTGALVSATRPTYSGGTQELVPGNDLGSQVLQSMRNYCNADVAVIQKRDLFRAKEIAGSKPDRAEIQQALDEVLWKGDFVLCRKVTGDILAWMMDQSDKYDSADSDRLSTDLEKNRGLLTLGIVKGAAKTWSVNAAALDKKALYVLATTDYLAAGDTGYSRLSKVDGLPPEPPMARKEHAEISALVCKHLGGNPCRPPLTTEDYFDRTTKNPLPSAAGMSFGQRLLALLSENWKMVRLLPEGLDKAEATTQNRRYQRLRLEKLQFAIASNLHSLSEANRKARFSGVQEAQPGAAEKMDITTAWRLRYTISGRHVDWFALTENDYQFTSVRENFEVKDGGGNTNNVERSNTTMPKNKVAFESGGLFGLRPWAKRNPTGIRFLLSARWETEFREPWALFRGSDGYDRRYLPRLSRPLGKAGLRYDGGKSWFEFGPLSGWNLQIRSMQLGDLTCLPGSTAACVPTVNGAAVPLSHLQPLSFSTTQGYTRMSGWFARSHLEFPTGWDKAGFTIDQSGNWFWKRKDDQAADTRYLQTFTPQVVLNIAGPLSVVPKVDIFLFQTKQNLKGEGGWHLHGYQTSINLQYDFDWHRGAGWRAFAFKTK